MKRTLIHTAFLLGLTVLLPLLGACDQEDNVVEIFTGRTWKLSYIAAEGDNKPFDFWGGNETAQNESMTNLERAGNFTVEFTGVDDGNGVVVGTFSGKGVLANVEGSWQADGKERTFMTSNFSQSGRETDVYARAFVSGLQNAFRYEGDSNNLFIYYNDGQTVKRLGFTPER